jgi:hypothetical protein
MSINIKVNYKNPNHIKQEGKQDNKGEPFKTKSRGVHNGKTCPHESHNDL